MNELRDFLLVDDEWLLALFALKLFQTVMSLHISINCQNSTKTAKPHMGDSMNERED